MKEANEKKTMVNGGGGTAGEMEKRVKQIFVLKRKGRPRLVRRNKGGF